MKRLLILLLPIFLVFFAGCVAQEEAEKPRLEVNNPADSSGDIDTQMVEGCTEPLYFSSVEEIAAAVQKERQAKSKDVMAQINGLEELSVLYAPANEIDGFQLWKIDVYPDMVFYKYNPEETQDPSFRWSKGIIVTVCRNTENYNVSTFYANNGLTPDEDGFAYDAEMGEMFFIQDDTVISIRVPENMNDYDTIRSMCEMEKIEIP